MSAAASLTIFIDIVNPDEEFTVADWQDLAFKTIDEIHDRGKNCVVVGGTGLYIRALVDNPSWQNLPPDPDLRDNILDDIESLGAEAVYKELVEFDPDAAGKIHPNNIPRLVRAVKLITKVLKDVIARCRKQVAINMNIPWAFYDEGKFLLLLDSPHDALNAYVKAVCASNANFMIETSLNSLINLKTVVGDSPGYLWVTGLLRLFSLARFRDENMGREIIADIGVEPLPLIPPVVIMAGTTGTENGQDVDNYRQMILDAFSGFRGTVISGGTYGGICRIVGDLQELHKSEVSTLGYLPLKLPEGVEHDPRYTELRRSTGDGFSPLEPIHYWADIISSGINPASVKLIGIGGGEISDFEYWLASAMGADVGVITGSGWQDKRNLTEWSAKIKNPVKIIQKSSLAVREFTFQ